MTKENVNGRGGRRYSACRVLVWFILVFATYELMVIQFLGGFVPDIEVDSKTGEKKIRRRPERHKKVVDGKVVMLSEIDGVLEGRLQLIDIVIPENALDGSEKRDRYGNVQGVFCVVEWDLQAEDPSAVPVFSDLTKNSEMCQSTRFVTDLYDVARQAESFGPKSIMSHHDHFRNKHARYIPPSVVVFHESRCGSTVVSNMLAAMAPHHSRVYSEALPPIKALQFCEYRENCIPSLHYELIHDVFYLMGRTYRAEEEQYVTYKIHAPGVRSIEAFTRAMPGSSWMFLYRNPVEVITSHLEGSVADQTVFDMKTPECLRDYGSKVQPLLLMEIVSAERRFIDSLSKEEYCAAYLATLCESAIREYERAEGSMTKRLFLNYENLPDKIWDSVLPHLGLELSGKRIHNLERWAAPYAKGANKYSMFHGDSEGKRSKASQIVKDAVDLFLSDRFGRLNALSKETLGD